jgi:hypothetical protein
MSPPEVWGPAAWAFFHTLAENVNDDQPTPFIQQIFEQIKRICRFLPCPECSRDATIFLGKININEIRTKQNLIDKLYVFHNYVNNKKRKPLFNYTNIGKYKVINLILVYNNFIKNYNTKGNMKLLAESFQRKLIVTDLKKWFILNIKRFSLIQKSVTNVPVVIEPVVIEPVVIEPVDIEPVAIEPNVIDIVVIEQLLVK